MSEQPINNSPKKEPESEAKKFLKGSIIIISVVLIVWGIKKGFSGSDTCVCKEQNYYERGAMDRAGLHQDQIINRFTIGEKVWDIETRNWVTRTLESIEKTKAELEAKNFECEWE